MYPLPGYHDAENIWVKILDMKSPHKSGQRQNIKVAERVVRCKNCFYAPFEQTDQVFITNYGSYKLFKDSCKTNFQATHL